MILNREMKTIWNNRDKGHECLGIKDTNRGSPFCNEIPCIKDIKEHVYLLVSISTLSGRQERLLYW